MAPKKKTPAAPTKDQEAKPETPVKKPSAKKSPAVVEEKTPAPAKRVAGKKSAREDEEAETAETPTSPVVPKKLRRESSTGGDCTLMPAAKDLENLTQEEAEKDTVAFDYDACLKSNNSKVFPPSSHYKIITWNVAGLRALMKPGYAKSELKTLIDEEAPDVLCLQETKLSDPNSAAREAVIEGYTFVESLSTAKLGYSGTRTYLRNGLFDTTKTQHFCGFDLLKEPAAVDPEGRVVASFLVPADNTCPPLTIVNNYVPNSGMKLERLDYRVADYDKMMREYLSIQIPAMEKTIYGKSAPVGGSVVWLGDLNVAERNYDRFHNGNYKTMQKSPGFTPPERASFRQTLKTADLVDSFRFFFPNYRAAYTFYSRMFNQRAKGNGWRLDYFAVSSALIGGGRVVGTSILNKFTGSDHVPSVLYVKRK